jgi:hypothetical protein
MAQASVFPKTFNSFSGVDIKGVFGNQTIAELQAVSYSITREKAPIYTMGSADPRAFSRGKRGIAGTLIFIVFDRSALISAFGTYQPNPAQQLLFLASNDEIRPEANVTASVNGVSITDATGNPVAVEQDSTPTAVGSDYSPAAPWFSDQIPPFDITLAAANEYGALAVMRIFGVELLNEGYGVSIDDIVSEMQHTYIARTLVGWQPVGQVNLVNPKSTSSSNT